MIDLSGAITVIGSLVVMGIIIFLLYTGFKHTSGKGKGGKNGGSGTGNNTQN